MKWQPVVLYTFFLTLLLSACGRTSSPSSSSNNRRVALVKSGDGTYYDFYCLKGKPVEAMAECAVEPRAVNNIQSTRSFLGGANAMISYLLFNLQNFPQEQVCGFLWNHSDCYQSHFLLEPPPSPIDSNQQCKSNIPPNTNPRNDPFFSFLLAEDMKHIANCVSQMTEILPNTVGIMRIANKRPNGTFDNIYVINGEVDLSKLRETWPKGTLQGIRFRLYPSPQGQFNIPLYSCTVLENTPHALHFLSVSSNCDRQALNSRPSPILGYMSRSQQPNTAALRYWLNGKKAERQYVTSPARPIPWDAHQWDGGDILGYVPTY